MKISIRGGHCPKITGASALLNELTEDRKVKDAVIKYLKQLGHEVLDVTPPDSTSTSSSDLAYSVTKANEWRADLFVSIHFNKAYDSYNGALGSEVCVYSTHDIAQRVVNGLGSLGFKNRGQKIRTNLYELKHTNMQSMIVEICFVEATEDVELYKKLGTDTIGKAIAEAISNKKVEVKPTWKKNATGWWYDLGNGLYPANKWVELSGEWYYFDDKGYAYENKWLKYKDKWYWFNADCKMVKDCILSINRKYYAFNNEGIMLENTTVNVNGNGELVL